MTERLGALARRYHLTLHGGSMLEVADDAGDGRVYNTAVTFDASGALVAVYRKIHLFDAEPTAQGKPYRESATTAAGDRIVTVECDGLRLGLATCYDLRFPELFRTLALRGAEIVVMPSAFTLETGRDQLGATTARPRHRERLLHASSRPVWSAPAESPHLWTQHGG